MQPNQTLPGFPITWICIYSGMGDASIMKELRFVILHHIQSCGSHPSDACEGMCSRTKLITSFGMQSEYWVQEIQSTAHQWKLFRLICHSHICIKNDLMNNFVPGLHSYIFNKMYIYSNLSILQHSVLIMQQNYGMFSVLTHHLTKLTGSIISVMNSLSFIPYISLWCKFL